MVSAVGVNKDRIPEILNFYEDQYAKLLEAKNYIDLYPYEGSKTSSGKQEAVYDILLYNTLFMLDVSVASKSLLLGCAANNHTEMNYFARALAVHCRDILHPGKDSVTSRLNAIVKLFNGDDVKPPMLSALIESRKAIKKIEKQHYDYFDKIRNHVFAHKLGSGLEQSKLLKTINAEQIIILSGGVFDNFIDLNKLLTGLLQFLDTTLPDSEEQ